MADNKKVEDLPLSLLDVAAEGGKLQDAIAERARIAERLETARKNVTTIEKELATQDEKIAKGEASMRRMASSFWRFS